MVEVVGVVARDVLRVMPLPVAMGVLPMVGAAGAVLAVVAVMGGDMMDVLMVRPHPVDIMMPAEVAGLLLEN